MYRVKYHVYDVSNKDSLISVSESKRIRTSAFDNRNLEKSSCVYTTQWLTFVKGAAWSTSDLHKSPKYHNDNFAELAINCHSVKK